MQVRRLTPSELEIVAPGWRALLDHSGEVEPGLHRMHRRLTMDGDG